MALPPERLKNWFRWDQPIQGAVHLPGSPPPRRTNAPEPPFSLDYKTTKDPRNPGLIYHVYFVNNSDGVLTSLESRSTGFPALDGVEGAQPIESAPRLYMDVQPGEAVKVDDYDEVVDAEFVCQLDIRVAGEHCGRKKFRLSRKGGFKQRVVLSNDLSLQ